jgi:hypothetical protein
MTKGKKWPEKSTREEVHREDVLPEGDLGEEVFAEDVGRA